MNKNSSIPKRKEDSEEIKRAFDFIHSSVDTKIKNPKKLFFHKDRIKVSGDGVFYTLQGEGKTMGMPACFLRLHICNLRCVWCDAWYTWNPNTPEFWTESKDWTIEKAKKRIEEVWGCSNPLVKKRVVITGGEPLLQKVNIDTLIEILPEWDIEIETNGTLMPTDFMLTRCQFNCSPKLENSQNPKSARIKGDVLTALNKVNTVFKFVVTSPQDLDEIERGFIVPFELDLEKILIMPHGVTSKEVWDNAKELVEYVKEKGYRLLGRLQCDIWGARRRV
jgi:organic radical activating enzyme